MNAEFIIGNYLLDINLVHLSQTLAMRTGTFGRVEGEHVRSRILVGDTRYRVHETLGVSLGLLGTFLKNHYHAIALFHGCCHTLADAFLIFVNAGPQFGLYLSDSQKTNFSVEHMPATDNNRVSPVVAQDTMAVKNKLDYGIALGLGAEYSIPKVGHFLAEARYYYGLGNIYGASKRDYFGKSNYGQIVLKLSYLFDITRTKNVKRK
jgi:hypothetical protein